MKLSHKTANEQREIAQKLYEKTGPSAVYDYGNKVDADYGYCEPCEADTPTIETATTKECMLCGQGKKDWVTTDPDCDQMKWPRGSTRAKTLTLSQSAFLK